MFDIDVVTLSRLQFGLTALYHFLFVPLTLGLSLLIAIMESVYVMTRRPIWRDMTKFWGLLFDINFAMGVATGITMEFQFGANWAYYCQYVGDIYGVPLAIEGLMAFFLEATFVGLFFFGWERLCRIGHLTVTWLVAVGSNFSALWIVIANAWMQNPVGAKFNSETMRVEMTSLKAVLFNPVAQDKFVHTVSAGYVIRAEFVLAIGAIYLLRGRHIELAKRSMTVAASFELASALSVVVLGDESGYTASENQKMKIAAIEAMWRTEPAPASFTLFGWPNARTQTTDAAVKIPWLLGLIATRSLDTPLPGIINLAADAETRIRNGIPAYAALQALHKTSNQPMLALELGFGPAVGLQRLLATTRDAKVCGIDHSATMFDAGSKRNRAGVRDRRLQLCCGKFHSPPWEDGAFDKAMLVNVVYFFTTMGEELREVHRTLRRGKSAVVYATERETMASRPFAGPATHRLFDHRSLRDALALGGFADEDIRTVCRGA